MGPGSRSRSSLVRDDVELFSRFKISNSHFIVIASEAKQSISPPKKEWIASLRSQ
jgi:hypothetical protein